MSARLDSGGGGRAVRVRPRDSLPSEEALLPAAQARRSGKRRGMNQPPLSPLPRSHDSSSLVGVMTGSVSLGQQVKQVQGMGLGNPWPRQDSPGDADWSPSLSGPRASRRVPRRLRRR